MFTDFQAQECERETFALQIFSQMRNQGEAESHLIVSRQIWQLTCQTNRNTIGGRVNWYQFIHFCGRKPEES